jgi:hypothetical protein
MARARVVDPETNQPYERVATKDLYLDAQNPRLAEYALGDAPTQSELLKILWSKMAVDELALSIASSGYFDYEPLFVVTEDNRDVVIEGNRRLAAVKILLDESVRRKLKIEDLPELSSAQRRGLETLPVIRTERDKIWQYIGFKHVNGPANRTQFGAATRVGNPSCHPHRAGQDLAVHRFQAR